MSYTIKHHPSSDTKTILDPAGWELITVQDMHRELNELLARCESAEKLCDHWERKAKVRLVPEPSEQVLTTTKVETISAAQAKASAIPANTLCVQPDWQRVRIDAAIAVMQGILASNVWPTKPVAQSAIEYSSELVAELKKEVAG